MKRYEFAINSALIPEFKSINDAMNGFGYDGHALGYKIGMVSCNIADITKIEEIRIALEKSMNEVLKEGKSPEIWLSNAREVQQEESVCTPN